MEHNQAPAPNRRPRFPVGSPGEMDYHLCAPPASPAAVVEAQRTTRTAMKTLTTLSGFLAMLSLTFAGTDSAPRASTTNAPTVVMIQLGEQSDMLTASHPHNAAPHLPPPGRQVERRKDN